ncbi:MAG TPA: outer membrane lipoprotein carrier protein LolA [Alphaproteobacteria bacterium]|nr:outer membrane lipoprotein carrier protein LolA [Alphaproteobacteria bacterium]
MPDSTSRRSLLSAALAFGFGAWLAEQRGAAAQAAMSAIDRADVARVEAYFNALKTLSARFQQFGEAGQTAEGQIFLSRPGRMRLEYDPPVPLLLIANNGLLLQYDKDLKTAAYVPLSSTPAAIILRDRVELSGDITVAQIERGPGVLRLTVTQTEDPHAGRITLGFSERPFALVHWRIVDAAGVATQVALHELRSDIPLQPSLFVFTPEQPERPAP